MPGPSCSRSRTLMRASHFGLTEPGQPGVMMRTGWPWMCGIAAPFRRSATSVCSSIALAMGVPRLIEGRSGSPERCGSAP